jgi:U4/U6 small nuclear ribonucleoprotein PRP31
MEATTTLADALLDDLDDLMESDEDDQNEASDSQHEDIPNKGGDDNRREGETVLYSSVHLSTQKSNQPGSSSTKGSEIVSQFLDNRFLQKHLKIIREHNDSSHGVGSDVKKPTSTVGVSKRKEKEEENHQLVVQSNKYLSSLEEELERAHGQLAKAYEPKFPELEELLPNHLHYKNAVRIIGNETDLTKVNDELNEILTSNQIITISMAGSTTSGRILTETELQEVDAAATYMEKLLSVQKDLMQFVENSMESLCPSICALIEAPTAARLLGLAGGLQELTKVSSIKERNHMHIWDCV